MISLCWVFLEIPISDPERLLSPLLHFPRNWRKRMGLVHFRWSLSTNLYSFFLKTLHFLWSHFLTGITQRSHRYKNVGLKKLLLTSSGELSKLSSYLTLWYPDYCTRSFLSSPWPSPHWTCPLLSFSHSWISSL